MQQNSNTATAVNGMALALIILLSICFYVPLIIDSLYVMRTTGDGLGLLICATGLELCQILLVVAGRSGFRG